MNTPYLVQRATRRLRLDKKGIDAIIQLDYMGSAEFEFGSVPKSLQRIRSNHKNYVRTQLTVSYNGYSKNLDVWSKQEDAPTIHEWLQTVAENKHRRCKEFIGLELHFSNSEITRHGLQYRNEDFWWDIENDFFFWFSNDQFTNILLSVLNQSNDNI